MKLTLINEKPLIWAHRGGRSLAAENTLGAVRKGYETGANGWEFDVQVTKDGEIILLHDLNLLRTTNARDVALFRNNPPLLPWRFTLEELRTLSADIFPLRRCNPQGDTPTCVPNDGAIHPDNRIPTLTEALRLTDELGIFANIEIKDMVNAVPASLRIDIIERIHVAIRAEAMEERVMITSFNHQYVRGSKSLAPHIPTGALTEHTYKGDALGDAIAIGADAWHPSFRVLTRDLVQQAREAGLAVTPYTVNSPKAMKRFVEWGVTGIVTDCPQNAPEFD